MDQSVIKVIRIAIGHISLYTIKLLRTNSVSLMKFFYVMYWTILASLVIFAIALINAIATRIVGN